MKKIISSTCFFVMLFLFGNAQSAEEPKTISSCILDAGNIMTYEVKANGNAYNFIVTLKDIRGKSRDPIVFDWEMTDPVNKNGTISIGQDATINSRAFYNQFAGGTKRLDEETSVFISFYLGLELAKNDIVGNIVKLKIHGASGAEESFTVIEDRHPFTYTSNGIEKTIQTVLLENKANGYTMAIYAGVNNPFIVEMSVGFDITLKSVR